MSNATALSSWQKDLCGWFSSILPPVLKLEVVVVVFVLQRVVSNNDTLSLSLLSGVPLTDTSMTQILVVPMTIRRVEMCVGGGWRWGSMGETLNVWLFR